MTTSNGDQGDLERDEFGALQDELKSELESARRELSEINLMLEQSQLEVNKLAQRNASITAHLQQVQGQFDSIPRSDIRTAYDSALDAQQRLFVMRGQLEKLQSDRSHIQRYTALLQRAMDVIEDFSPHTAGGKGYAATTETVEMMINAQEAERLRLARQMHDEPAQALSNFILQTEIAIKYFDLDQNKAKEELASIKTAATSTFKKVRDFIFELRPMMLDDLGLAPTLSRYIEAYKDQSGVEIRLAVSGLEQRLEPYLEVMIFRAVQELVSNAVRHSQPSMVKVQVDATDSEVRLTVDDNGKGFEVESALARGMGIKVIRDRVEMLGGAMDISSIVGQGTHILFQIPVGKSKVFA